MNSAASSGVKLPILDPIDKIALGLPAFSGRLSHASPSSYCHNQHLIYPFLGDLLYRPPQPCTRNVGKAAFWNDLQGANQLIVHQVQRIVIRLLLRPLQGIQ